MAHRDNNCKGTLPRTGGPEAAGSLRFQPPEPPRRPIIPRAGS